MQKWYNILSMKTIERNQQSIEGVIQIASFCAQKEWVPATSGNFSVRNTEESIAITVSGKDKANLQTEDVMLVDFEGQALDGKKPSAETLLHTQLYRRFPETEAIAHIHSTTSTVLSKIYYENGRDKLILKDLELLKALSGVTTHQHIEDVPIFENNQSLSELAIQVETYIQNKSERTGFHGYLIVGHGLYTWGTSVEETLRHVEAFNALFETTILESKLKGDFQ